MIPILVYGVPLGSSMGLVAAMEWLGRPYQLCRVDMLGEMREPAYARINARHETPVLIAPGGHVVTETMAIAGVLEACDVDRRVSFAAGTPQSDRMHQLMAFLNTGFTGAFSPLWTVMEAPDMDAASAAVLRRYGEAAVRERHDKLEAMLGDTPFLAGPHPTLADAVFAGVARWREFHGVGGEERWPKIAALRARIEADAAVTFALAIERGEQPVGTGTCRGHVALREVIQRHGA